VRQEDEALEEKSARKKFRKKMTTSNDKLFYFTTRTKVLPSPTMNLKNLEDKALIKNTERIAQGDHATLVTLLHHLREIEARRLFSDLKYQSLFDFTVRHLKYSEDEAQRRIVAMRLLREIPEIEAQIADASLNLTNICLAQTLFAKEKKAGRQCDKRGVLAKLRNKSTREARKVVAEINPEMNKTKTLTFDMIEDESLRQKLLRVKGLYAHSNPNLSLTDLLHLLADKALADKSPAAPRKSAEDKKPGQTPSKAKIYRYVWRRDEEKCTNCGSYYAVQSDHIHPWAAGGGTTIENSRLLCRNCNLRAAVAFFGREKMRRYYSG
jgi:5-methylcytosine-specific restriction endonuclease McrA